MNAILSQVDQTPIVSLTDDEFAKVKDVAQKITSTKRARGSATWHRHYADDDILPTLMAMVAEKGFEKTTGIEVNLSYHRGGDKGVDAQYKNKSIQIKTANIGSVKTPNLLVRKDHAHADIYILSAWDSTTPKNVMFLGYASRDELIKTDCSFSKAPSYIVYQRHLRPVAELGFFGKDKEPQLTSDGAFPLTEVASKQEDEAVYKARIRRELGDAYRVHVLKQPALGFDESMLVDTTNKIV